MISPHQAKLERGRRSTRPIGRLCRTAECNKNYADPTLSFCLNEEPATAILNDTETRGDAPARAQIYATHAELLEKIGLH